MSSAWWQIPVGVVAGLALLWLVMLALLWRVQRGMSQRVNLREALRLVPDTMRLIHRLTGDRTLPRGIRVRLLLLLGYLLLPFDLVPDFIPVLGHADDAIIVAIALRSVVRGAGRDAVERHWPGSAEGLEVMCRLAGI